MELIMNRLGAQRAAERGLMPLVIGVCCIHV